MGVLLRFLKFKTFTPIYYCVYRAVILCSLKKGGAKVIAGFTWILLSLYFSSLVFAAEINLSRSKLLQLAQHIAADEPEKHYYFSQIAVFEMMDSYQRELERSLTQVSKTMKKRAKVRHWRFATYAYLETLNEYLFLMDSGVQTSFFISPQNKIFLLIGNVPVIISGPNSGEDKKIEKNIVENYCLEYDCQEYFKNHLQNNRPAAKASFLDESQSGEWSIKSQHQFSYIVDDTLIFNFSNMQDRKNKEKWAINIAAELQTLLAALHKVKKRGKIIDWSLLMIEELPLTDNAEKVMINQQADYIKIALPMLLKNSPLFPSFIPWLKKHFEQQLNYRMIIDNAEQYIM